MLDAIRQDVARKEPAKSSACRKGHHIGSKLTIVADGGGLISDSAQGACKVPVGFVVVSVVFSTATIVHNFFMVITVIGSLVVGLTVVTNAVLVYNARGASCSHHS